MHPSLCILKRVQQVTESLKHNNIDNWCLCVLKRKITRKGFFKKKHSCGFIFSKLCYTESYS